MTVPRVPRAWRCVTLQGRREEDMRALDTLKPRQHFVYLSVHVSRPCWIGGSPLISMIGLSHVEGTFCLYMAWLLVKPRLIE